jgi:hypothetical protein
LNQIHVAGSLAIAGVVGFLTTSWAAFAVTAAVLLAAGVANGDIRPNRHRRR